MAEAHRFRREYLDAASQTLMFSSPAVAAHLQIVNNQDFENSKPNAQTKSCSACGSMMLLGRGCRRTTRHRTKRTRQGRLSESGRSATVSLECLACSSITTVVKENLRKPKNAAIKLHGAPPQRIPAVQPLQAPRSAGERVEAPTALDAGGKRRGRGKKSSLQAILADRKTTGTSSGFGLSMDDFMK
ncbi:hypothetical protein AC579_2022 [Pseudocercospora musae]|uniref:Uncharacterized protein n=1 Tax=Pseudocercospora musae TaxID=113226 RepID=A0A139IRC3_9PEZI|nr:hypothetical protein AC579_2022 [Pseudocercospora musae]